MTQFNRRAQSLKSGGVRGAMLAGLGIAASFLAATGALAEEKFQLGDVDWTVNGLLTLGTSIRTTPQDPTLLTKANGSQVGLLGTAVKGQNQDDGDLNYKQWQAVSSPIQGDLSIDARYKNVGFTVSAKAWYDFTLEGFNVPHGNEANGYVPNTPLSDAGFANEAKFSGIQLMDAFVYGKFQLGATNVEARVGNQVIHWGLNTQIAGGLLTSINGIDFNAVYRPGSQPDEMLNREPAVYGKVDVTDKIGIEAFYRFTPSVNTPLGCGTFFSSADYVQTGCNYVLAGGPGTDAAQIAAGYVYNRAATPSFSDPQVGVGGTFLADALHTKFGAYYAHVDSTLLFPGAITTTRSLATPFVPSTNPAVYAKNPEYFTSNPPNVDVFTFNFQTQLNNTRIYGEATIKPDAPIGYNASDMLAAFASPVAATQLRSVATALGATGQSFPGYTRLAQGNFDLGATQTIAGVLGAKDLTLGGEAGVKEVFDLPDVNVTRFGRSDVYGIGPVAGVCPVVANETPAMNALRCSNNGYVTASAWGYRLNARLNYVDVFTPGLNISPSIGLSQDVYGWSADTLFNQGRVILNLGLQAEYKKRFFGGATWNPELQTAAYDQNSDRQVFTVYAGVKF